ncbi:MAG: hypothetical protein WAK00_11475 [Microbacterium sp.]|uniref:PqqD family protein n=1 Tax=Microbacterium sp. TaxID=51671 RepID=UPI003BB18DB5
MTAGFRVTDRVGVIDEGEVLYAATLPRGPIVVLEGTAALVWREACSGPADTLVERITPLVDAGSIDIAGSVTTFMEDLVARGLLERT